MKSGGLQEVIDLLVDAEARTFYAFSGETRELRKFDLKSLNKKIRGAVEDAVLILEEMKREEKEQEVSK